MRRPKVAICILIFGTMLSTALAQSTFIDKDCNATGLSLGYLFIDINQEYGKVLHGFGGSFSTSYHGLLDLGGQLAYARLDSTENMVFAPQIGFYPFRISASSLQFIPGIYTDMEISSSPLIWTIGVSGSIDLKISGSLSLQPAFVITRQTMPRYTQFNWVAYSYGIAFAFHGSPGTTYIISSSLAVNEYTTDAAIGISIIFGHNINRNRIPDPWSKYNP